MPMQNFTALLNQSFADLQRNVEGEDPQCAIELQPAGRHHSALASREPSATGSDNSTTWSRTFKPTRPGNHWPVCTLTLCFLMLYLFAFMAGQLPYYKVVRYPDGVKRGAAVWGPQSFLANLQFWSVPEGYAFDGRYLLEWGGRQVPCLFVLRRRWLGSSRHKLL